MLSGGVFCFLELLERVKEKTILNSSECVRIQACKYVFPVSPNTVFYSASDTHLASSAIITSLTESSSRGHDPFTHVRMARLLTVFGEPFLSVSLSSAMSVAIVIVIVQGSVATCFPTSIRTTAS